MLCKKPFYAGGTDYFPCGQCLPCRINRRRLWTHRIILEALKHEASSFVTLTYSNEHVPSDGSLNPRHLQLYLKSLRQAIIPFRLRFYAVGEYGDSTHRPHYHIALFGLGPQHANVIQACWRYGFTYTGQLTLASAQYVAGYVTKKMTSKDDPRLNGRYPEFARMSNRPGIGAHALDELEDFLYSEQGAKLLMQTKDVPLFLMHGGKKLPLGRYLRGKLRERLQIPSPVSSQISKEQFEKMSQMFKDSQDPNKSLTSVYKAITKPKILSIENRYKIFNGRNKKL